MDALVSRLSAGVALVSGVYQELQRESGRPCEEAAAS
jgi:hypothetical protein